MKLKSITYRFNPYPNKERVQEPKIFVLDYK